MEHRIDDQTARSQFGEIVDLAVRNDERFVVDRKGEPAVVIMSVRDFIRTMAPPPDWLQKTWAAARERGADKLTPDEIEAEISACRRELKSAAHTEPK